MASGTHKIQSLVRRSGTVRSRDLVAAGATRAQLSRMVAAGELVRCDAGQLAGSLQATLNGSMVNWAVHRKGSLAAWLRRDLRGVLTPYRSRRGGRIMRRS